MLVSARGLLIGSYVDGQKCIGSGKASDEAACFCGTFVSVDDATGSDVGLVCTGLLGSRL